MNTSLSERPRAGCLPALAGGPPARVLLRFPPSGNTGGKSRKGSGERVAVLFAQARSVYFGLDGCDVYDAVRDARSFSGGLPVVAHPPCRGWGRLRGLANPAPGERELGFFAVDCVRRFGGVLEHPAGSTLWAAAGLPVPGLRDEFGGWTLPILQQSFGHRAAKPTWLYIVGAEWLELPRLPLVLGEASHVVGGSRRRRDGGRLHRGDPGWRPEVSKREREATPVALADWLVEVARIAGRWMLP